LAENSNEPVGRKAREMERARQMRSLQEFASVHALVFNHFKQSRTAALIEWRGLLAG